MKTRSEIMRSIKSKDTAPELAVRRIIYSLGYRYRLHRKDIPGCPDISFIGRKKVIFVHGCFWHQHDSPQCKIVHKPKTNTSYWSKKLQRNVERDKRYQELLKKSGWKFLIIWECELTDIQNLKRKLIDFIEKA